MIMGNSNYRGLLLDVYEIAHIGKERNGKLLRWYINFELLFLSFFFDFFKSWVLEFKFFSLFYKSNIWSLLL